MSAARFRMIALALVWCALPSLGLAQESWSVQLSAEAGVGMREVDLPRDGVITQVRSGGYPALGVGFVLEHHAAQRFSVGLTARYQTSIGLTLHDQLAGGAAHERSTRSHHFEAGIAPRLHWDDSGWEVGAFLGYGIVELDPLNHLVTPSYHLGGGHMRLSVRVPLGTERVGLCLGPEAQWILHTGAELRERGVATNGFGAGGQAAIELRLGPRWTVAASYRELRYWLSTQQGPSFGDAVRVISAQLRGTL